LKNLLTVLLLFVCGVGMAGNADIKPTEYGAAGSTICVFTDFPQLGKFSAIKDLKVGRNFYGGTEGITDWTIRYIRKQGGNAIVNSNIRQAFGFWPWQVVRPVSTGTIIRWSEKTDEGCLELGGQLFSITERNAVFETTGTYEPIPSAAESLSQLQEESAASGLTESTDASSGKSLDIYDNLLKLDELRDMGLITDEEFDEQKAKLLNGQ
jgi:hypothetical protein